MRLGGDLEAVRVEGGDELWQLGVAKALIVGAVLGIEDRSARTRLQLKAHIAVDPGEGRRLDQRCAHLVERRPGAERDNRGEHRHAEYRDRPQDRQLPSRTALAAGVSMVVQPLPYGVDESHRRISPP